MTNRLRRYALFAFEQYYPGGGWEDFKGSFDTLDEAREAMTRPEIRDKDFVQIVDLYDGSRVV